MTIPSAPAVARRRVLAGITGSAGPVPRRSRSELVITETLDNAIATAASPGFRIVPVKGYSTPIATGIRTTL